MSGDGPISSIVKTVRAKVAGKAIYTAIYYLVALVALVIFILGAYSIVSPVINGEVVTSVETKFLPEITYPTIFACLSPTISSGDAAARANIRRGGRDDTTCPEQARLIHGSLELSTSVTCLPINDLGDPGNAQNEDTIRRLRRLFNVTNCILVNADGRFKTRPGNRSELILSFHQENAIVEQELYGLIGVYRVGTSPFNANGELTAEFFRAGYQNTLSTTGLQMDTIIDRRRESFITLPSSVSSVLGETDPEITTELYTLTTTSTTRHYTNVPSTTPDLVVAGTRDGSDTGPQSDYVFYVSTFTSREITQRKRSFAEVWAMLGGALASALVIITWFFKEEVVGDEPSGPKKTEKVQVFRFQSVADAKREALDYVRSLDSYEAPGVPAPVELAETTREHINGIKGA